MNDGLIGGQNAANTAKNGGAVYVNGGDFTMISGVLSYNNAIASSNAAAEAGTEGYGGGVFANGGNIVVGVPNCAGTGENHTSTYTNKKHPKVIGNDAVFGGGLAVMGKGNVTLYCGKMQNNISDNNGTGMNVFMGSEEGQIKHYLEEAQIGEDTDHGMVSVGGTLTIVHGTAEEFIITIHYNSNTNNDLGEGVDVTWTGTAPAGYYLNLPYCPTAWRTQQATHNLTFVGWVESEDGALAKNIRDRDDYKDLGTAVQIVDKYPDDPNKNEMHFYAVWAPYKNYITYGYSLNDTADSEVKWDNADGKFSYSYDSEFMDDNGNFYLFEMTGTHNWNLGEGVMPGYTFQGWKYYASEKTISNWDADAEVDPAETLSQIPGTYLTDNQLTTTRSFGDIRVVAVFKPAFTDLTITKEGTLSELDNPSFIFRVEAESLLDKELSEKDYVLYVVIDGTGSATIKELPVGTYIVTEQVDWSWRYAADNQTRRVELTDPDNPGEVAFTNSRSKTKWLDGEDYVKNEFSK